MLIRMTGAAWLLLAAPEHTLLDLVGVRYRMTFLARDRKMCIAQREPCCCMVSHTQGRRAKSADRVAGFTGTAVRPGGKLSAVCIGMTICAMLEPRKVNGHI
jgi:hypothetical protein